MHFLYIDDVEHQEKEHRLFGGEVIQATGTSVATAFANGFECMSSRIEYA